tara:strand:+ start:3878 stop:4336 length:459 start_codon:yes stop_codon:yes gene_type:complete
MDELLRAIAEAAIRPIQTPFLDHEGRLQLSMERGPLHEALNAHARRVLDDPEQSEALTQAFAARIDTLADGLVQEAARLLIREVKPVYPHQGTPPVQLHPVIEEALRRALDVALTARLSERPDLLDRILDNAEHVKVIEVAVKQRPSKKGDS